MIIGKVSELPFFFSLHPALEYIHKFVVEYQVNPKPIGDYVVVPDRVRANIATYSTTSGATRKLEAHKKYCDVQVMLKGSERIDWAPLSSCETQLSEEYSRGGDIAFYSDPQHVSSIILNEDVFVLFRPEDAHKPCLIEGNSSEKVTKIVFKFLL